MDVIVENRKTGERKPMTATMAKMLETKYRIVPEANTLEKNPNFEQPKDAKTDLEQLQDEYANLFGSRPHHRLGEAKLKSLIEEEKDKKSQ